MTKDVAVKETGGVALPASVASSDWGAIEGLETTDLLVPKIFHQQALSKFASDGVARPGDFCDSLTGEVLATKDKKLEVIIFGSFKTMVITLNDKLKEIVTITRENAAYWDDKQRSVEEGVDKWEYNLYYNYYCLVPSKIKELPYVLSLGSTKTKVARKLNTMLYKLQQLKRPGASVVFELTSTSEKNDKGSWFGLEIAQGRNASDEELLRAHAWHVKSKSQKFTVVEEEMASANDEDDLPY